MELVIGIALLWLIIPYSLIVFRVKGRKSKIRNLFDNIIIPIGFIFAIWLIVNSLVE